MDDKVCIKDYESIEAAAGDQSKLPQPIHGTTQVSPGEASVAHDLDKKPIGKWCLLVGESYAGEAKKILGLTSS
jgi:hypothetical protein